MFSGVEYIVNKISDEYVGQITDIAISHYGAIAEFSHG